MRRALVAACGVMFAGSALAQSKYFGDWPAGTDPREVGKRVVEAFIPVADMEMPSHGPKALHYSHVGTWTGALQYAQLIQDKDLTRRLVDRFDIGEFRDKLVKDVSGGQRRRVDLAASLVTPPELLVLDEPTTGLDPRSRMAVWDAVTTLVDEGVTVLLTTQYLEEADRLADRIAVIDGGNIVAQGTAAELKAHAAVETLDEVFLAVTA
jgi:ABC-type Mn2+/Zn2+ transport system ATPase subunit